MLVQLALSECEFIGSLITVLCLIALMLTMNVSRWYLMFHW